MKDYTLDLQKLGLSDKEAKIYLAALELGADTAQNISKRAGVNRATAYVAIKALTSFGLMSTFEKGKKQYFVALNPEKLIDLYEKEHIELEEKRLQVERLIPELKKLHSLPGEKSRVQYFEGKEAILSMVSRFYKDMRGGAVLSFSPLDSVRQAFSAEELNKLQDFRVRSGVTLRGIYTSNERVLDDRGDRAVRKLPAEKFPLHCDVAIYGNETHIITPGDKPTGIVIDDKQFANTMRSIFELAWEGAERYTKL